MKKTSLFSPSHSLSSGGGFLVQALKWHCSGDSLMLIGKEQLCLCYMEAEQQDS